MQAEQVLLEALASENPLVLLWGQQASLSVETETYLNNEIKKHLGLGDVITGWKSLLTDSKLPENFYSWLSERFSRCPLPQGLEEVSNLPWSAVFTSSLDPALARVLSTERREPHAVLTASEVPPAARSTARTPVYYLFGRAGASDPPSMPPTNRSSLRIRTNVHAVPMLNRLSDAVTSLGLLVIDGLHPSKDWLSIELLLPVLEQMPAHRILWCGAKEEDLREPDVRNLVEAGHLVVTVSPLATVMARLAVDGLLVDLPNLRLSDQSSTITIRTQSGLDEVFEIPPSLRIRVETSATIVDDSWTAFNSPLGPETEYSTFRRFHGDLEGTKSIVEGIRRDFAIHREFESTLWSVIELALKSHSRYSDPIIIHGQSATGKSIALARIAVKLRTEHGVPVLYATSRVPSEVDIDAFCESLDHCGVVTVVICDNNASIQRYRDLLFSLRSKGRRVILVCSTYRQLDLPMTPPKGLVEASDGLSSGEKTALLTLVRRFSPITEMISHVEGDNILYNLYYHLPATRGRLIEGVGRETRAWEELIRSRSVSKPENGASLSYFAQQLLAAGLSQNGQALQTSEDPFATLNDDAARLINLVMIPGQVDCNVPIDILMRAMDSQSERMKIDRIVSLFGDLDLFRWKRGEHAEELLVGPRLALEAQLICRRRLMNPATEGEFLTQLIGACRLNWDAGGSERRFILELLQRIGPDGPQGEKYFGSYIHFARALTSLRTSHGVLDPSLMLQESALRRAAVKKDATAGSPSLEVLEEARTAVQEALEFIDKNWRTPASRTKTNLLVEQATIYGFLATQQLALGANNKDIWAAYSAARVAAKSAVGASATYFPLDVSLWIPQDLLEASNLTPEQRFELKADILSTLERVDPSSYPYEQQERFNRRKFILGQALGDANLSEEAFVALAAQGGTAGYYLRARTIGPSLESETGSEITPSDYQGAEEALAFLETYWREIQDDERCLRFYLQCKWMICVRQRLFRQERGGLPYLDQDRRKILSIVESINTLASLGKDNQMLYLKAVLAWLTGDEQSANETWGFLSRETEFLDPKRPTRRHVVTDANGTPTSYAGRIEGGEDPFWIRVDGLGRRIRLLGRDFSTEQPAYGRQIPSFGIAFNYIGPIADPIVRKGGR